MKNKHLLIKVLLIIPIFLISGFMPIFNNNTNSHLAKFTILYDNYSSQKDIKTAWGFSCLIESNNKTILFDTGGDAKILKHNVETLEIDLSTIDIIVISHEHWDHVGGLKYVLEKNSTATVYVPASFAESKVKELENLASKVIKTDKPVKITENIYLTGEMMNVEQSLIVDTPKGSIIVTGCSHQGIVSILKKAKKIIDKDIFLVFGGFHLLRHSTKDVEIIINEFLAEKVEFCGATHCTGGPQIQQFKDAYKDFYLEVGAGKEFIVAKNGIE